MRGGWLAMLVLTALLALFTTDVAKVSAEEKSQKAEAEAHTTGGHSSSTAGHEEKADPFKLALDLTIWTIVVFLLLLFVLSRFAWKPMLEGLRKREEAIQAALDDAKRAQEEAQRLREEFQAEKLKTADQVRAMIDEARRDAQATADDMIKKAKADIQTERERMRREMDVARDQALQELWTHTANLATLISSRALSREVNEADHRRLVDEALNDLRKAGSEQLRTTAVLRS